LPWAWCSLTNLNFKISGFSKQGRSVLRPFCFLGLSVPVL
jgi:hypothetical protein